MGYLNQSELDGYERQLARYFAKNWAQYIQDNSGDRFEARKYLIEDATENAIPDDALIEEFVGECFDRWHEKYGERTESPRAKAGSR